MGEPKSTYPCTGRPACGGTAQLTFQPGSWRPEGDFIGDRTIYECDTCGLQWGEDGQPLHHHREQGGNDEQRL